MEMFIESVAITCRKCGNMIPFNVNIPITYKAKRTLFEEVVDQNKDHVATFRDFGNCNQGYLNESNQTFTCKACLEKALKKKQDRKK